MSGCSWAERGAIAAAGIVVAFCAHSALGAVESGAPVEVAELAAPDVARPLDGATDVRLRFVQDGGPSSGRVRVELTPDAPLTLLEARMAAQQAFLEALNEPGLGEPLTSIRVDVDLVPGNDDPALRRSYFYLATGADNWSVSLGD